MFFGFKRKKKEKFDFSKVFEKVVRNEIKLTAGGAPASPDASKIGGRPFLPKDFVWPYFASEDGEKPLSFLCQVNMAEVKPYDSENLLPEKGLLLFFYEAETQPWGYDPEDNSAFRVCYYEETAGFAPFEIPTELAADLRPAERALVFEKRASYPDFEEVEFHAEVAEGVYYEDYVSSLEELGKDMEEDTHKLLGYADIMQNEMLTECESVSRGNSCGGYEELEPEEEADIQKCAKEWILLLQLSTLEGEEYELMWGDCGRLYFYIRKEDLKKKNFENARLVLQCG
ncbi:MAG: DUF1963 domain-containing protein [Clostridia bacterium]|nr:DUF1963 domain-containing protein [Clostridia bacterium]